MDYKQGLLTIGIFIVFVIVPGYFLSTPRKSNEVFDINKAITEESNKLGYKVNNIYCSKTKFAYSKYTHDQKLCRVLTDKEDLFFTFIEYRDYGSDLVFLVR